jgi:hypothetical protein
MPQLTAAALAAGLLVSGSPAANPPAASVSSTITAAADIGGLAKLSLSATSLGFPDADPDTLPLIPAAPGSIAITAKARTTPGGTVTLTVQASDVLRSGTDTIPIAALQWTAAGPGFLGGAMDTSTAQAVGTWLNSGVRSGTQAYQLQNAWTRAVGTYTTTLTYTLTAQ